MRRAKAHRQAGASHGGPGQTVVPTHMQCVRAPAQMRGRMDRDGVGAPGEYGHRRYKLALIEELDHRVVRAC